MSVVFCIVFFLLSFAIVGYLSALARYVLRWHFDESGVASGAYDVVHQGLHGAVVALISAGERPLLRRGVGGARAAPRAQRAARAACAPERRPSAALRRVVCV